jgi:signal transduction histidine kinase
MFNDVHATRSSEFKEKRIEFDNQFPLNFIWKVRREPLRRIIQNLMDNVVKYALEGSEFSAGLLTESSWEIKNDAAWDPTIKAPFSAGVRGKKAMDKPGEGIGLYVVKLCAKLIGCECKFIQKKYAGETKATIAIDIIKTEYKKI